MPGGLEVDLRAASRISSRVQIGGIRLVEAGGVSPTPGSPPQADVAAQYGATVVQAPDSEGEFRVHARVRVRDATSDAKPVFLVHATFEILYRLKPGDEVSEHELQSFAQINAVFNAWPYFREFVHMMMMRMDLPPLVIPVYRLPRPEEATKADG